MRSMLGLLRLCSAAALPMVACVCQALSISLVPAGQTIPNGSTLTYDVVAADVAPQVISTYDLDVNFDPTFLQYVTGSAAPGAGLGSSPFAFGDTPGAGVVSLFELSSLSDVQLASGPQASSPFTLASLAFRGIAPTEPGSTQLTLTLTALGGTTDDVTGATTDLIALLQPTINNALLTITPRQQLPEPGSLLLIATALVLLVARSRRTAR